jgi:HlyD family secretion protein
MKPQTSISTRSSKGAATPERVRTRKNGAWRKVIPYGIAAALLAAIVAGLLPKPTEVEVATVVTKPLTVFVLEEGKTRIRHRYIISPPVAGFLNRVQLRPGARLEAGKTVVATIQPQPASFLDPRARAETEARVKAAEATKMQRETQIGRAGAALDLAQKDFKRANSLKTTGAISMKEFDDADNQVNMLTRELHSSEFALQVANFEYDQAKAALVQVESPTLENVEPYKVTSPVNGYVLNVYEESARMLTAGTQIMEVGDPADLEAEIELLSSDAVAVRPGAEVSIEQWGGDAPLRGKVTMVEPGGYTKVSALGVEEQRVKVRVEFVDPIPKDHPLGDRFRVEARIITWHGDKVLQAPTGALFRRGGDWMTFVFDGSRARLQKVEILHNNGVAAEIRGGLTQGQRVILHPPDSITDGAAVKAKEDTRGEPGPGEDRN